jgi:hypothetical protein
MPAGLLRTAVLAYDSRRNAIWTTNESAGTETIVDANTMRPRETVDLGGEVRNVAYDPISDLVLVAIQGRNDFAVIDPHPVPAGSNGLPALLVREPQ